MLNGITRYDVDDIPDKNNNSGNDVNSGDESLGSRGESLGKYVKEAHLFLNDHNLMVHFSISTGGKLILNLEKGFRLKIAYLYFKQETDIAK